MLADGSVSNCTVIACSVQLRSTGWAAGLYPLVRAHERSQLPPDFDSWCWVANACCRPCIAQFVPSLRSGHFALPLDVLSHQFVHHNMFVVLIIMGLQHTADRMLRVAAVLHRADPPFSTSDMTRLHGHDAVLSAAAGSVQTAACSEQQHFLLRLCTASALVRSCCSCYRVLGCVQQSL